MAASLQQSGRQAFPRAIGPQHRRPLALYTGRGAIWPKLRLPVALCSSYALLVWMLYYLNLSPNVGKGAGSLTAILSMVTGLMVSFRSSSSNDRWNEGRKVWASFTSTIRTLQRTLVYGLPTRAKSAGPLDRPIDESLALVVAFAYAVKHHLRDEEGTDFGDMKDLLPPNFSLSMGYTPRSRLAVGSVTEAERELKVANTDTDKSLAARATPDSMPNVPLAIIRQLHASINVFHTTLYPSDPAMETVTWANCMGLLKDLTELLTTAERIRDTPIPLALGVHLQQIIWLYIITIPPQLVENLGLWVVPVTAIAAYTFFGVDRISEELSDPFGVEANDLPVDRFCSDLRREWLELIGQNNGAVPSLAAVKTE